MNNNTLYLVLDEIGAIHIETENYFGYGGYITNDYNLVQRKSNKIEKILKNNNNYIKKLPEIKGTKLKPKHIVDYISFVQKNSSFTPVHILINKQDIKNLNLKNENDAYNYFVKELINFLLKTKIISNCTRIVLLLDKRNISTNLKTSFETHLNSIFHNYKITFKVEYKDSIITSYIRLADIICYCLFRINNYLSTKRAKEILKFLVKEKINLNKNNLIFAPSKKEKNIKKIDLFSKDDII